MEAGGQHRLLVRPGGALARELGQEGGFRFFRLLMRLRKQLFLLCQLRSQPVALLRQLAALLLLDTQRSVGLA